MMSLHVIRLTHGGVSSLPALSMSATIGPPPSILILLSILFISGGHLLSFIYISNTLGRHPGSSLIISFYSKMARLRPSSSHNLVAQFFPTLTPFLQQSPSPLFPTTHVSRKDRHHFAPELGEKSCGKLKRSCSINPLWVKSEIDRWEYFSAEGGMVKTGEGNWSLCNAKK
jgi:hypothetical protein